ncbi:MAG: sulfur carrier protein ThiS [Desulfovibrionaceae bacterium]|nr:sulfur carrier protein ThiS [Desulfovibrionaceae bacterium]
MNLTVNGRNESCPDAASVTDLLHLRGHEPGRVVVEVNGRIVPAGEFAVTTLQDGDQVEIVQFVGGG